MVHKWHNLYKQGRDSLEDDPRPGRPDEVAMSELIAKAEKLVLHDARLNRKQFAEMA